MKLVDKDEIMKFPVCLDNYDETNGRRQYVLGIEAVLGYIHEMPTIDAIPIEWLKNKISQYETETLNLRDRSYYKTNLGEVYVHSLTTSEVERLNDLCRKSNCYSTILEEWEKENGNIQDK